MLAIRFHRWRVGVHGPAGSCRDRGDWELWEIPSLPGHHFGDARGLLSQNGSGGERPWSFVPTSFWMPSLAPPPLMRPCLHGDHSTPAPPWRTLLSYGEMRSRHTSILSNGRPQTQS